MINTEDQIFGITHLFKRHNEHPFSVEFVLTQNIANDIHNCLYLNEKKKTTKYVYTYWNYHNKYQYEVFAYIGNVIHKNHRKIQIKHFVIGISTLFFLDQTVSQKYFELTDFDKRRQSDWNESEHTQKKIDIILPDFIP